MAQIVTHEDLSLDNPVLVEGLPGVGLVGKIAADHLVETLEMTQIASCHCEGLPRVAVYQADEREVRQPVRIYGDEDRDLLVLQSDVPVSPNAAPEFATCVTSWFDSNDALPVCISGLPEEKEDPPRLFGIGSGQPGDRLEELGVPKPPESGMVSGPTGALLAEAGRQDVPAVGLVVQANAQFPDPESARVVLTKGVGPLADVEVETERLVEQADRIATAREQLAERMQEAEEESSQAQPLGMYH